MLHLQTNQVDQPLHHFPHTFISIHSHYLFFYYSPVPSNYQFFIFSTSRHMPAVWCCSLPQVFLGTSNISFPSLSWCRHMSLHPFRTLSSFNLKQRRRKRFQIEMVSDPNHAHVLY